jgi:hypothetical protein
VPRLLRPRLGPLGLALTFWDVYRRLPPRQRKLLLDLARQHGPKAATKLMQLRRATKKR